MFCSKSWLLPLLIFVIVKTSQGDVSDKTKQKLDNPNENYIITHYGVEYYTPVVDVTIQPYKSGYFKAEVIPVDINTGEELKTVKNIFVPMHTGYSIGVDDNSRNNALEYDKNYKITNRKQIKPVLSQQFKIDKESRDEPFFKTIDNKNKIPKKFKKKYVMTNKKQVKPSGNNNFTNNDVNTDEQIIETNKNLNKKLKRQIIETPNEILRRLLLYNRFNLQTHNSNHWNNN
ncbi:hypothetical protein PGB90_008404 [Kerria lacca]